MKFYQINLIGKTMLVNLEQIAFVEEDPTTYNAIITMANGDRLQTNEDFDELSAYIARESGQ